MYKCVADIMVTILKKELSSNTTFDSISFYGVHERIYVPLNISPGAKPL